jgi:hypothetical protein
MCEEEVRVEVGRCLPAAQEADRRWQSAKGLPTEGDFPAPSSASASASVAPFHNVVQPAIGSSVPGSGGRSRRPLAMGAIQEATTSNSRGGVNNRRPLSADAAARPPQPVHPHVH